MCRASCRTLGPDTKTTARHWGGKGELLWPARRTAAAFSVSASWLQNKACGAAAVEKWQVPNPPLSEAERTFTLTGGQTPAL